MRSNLNFNNLSTSNTYDNKELEVTIKDFGGADYSHSTLFVDTSRATEMSNFIKEDGINQKRKGFREIYQAPVSYISDPTTNKKLPLYKKINGVWELTTSMFDEATKGYIVEKNTIIQQGNKFYVVFKEYTKIENGEQLTIRERGITTDANDYDSQYKIVTEEIPFPQGLDFSDRLEEDTLSYGVVADERLYILTGKLYLMIGYFNGILQVRRVEDDDFTYIPTTTINIPPKEYNDIVSSADMVLKSTAFDQVNMLHRKRINRFVGLTEDALNVYLINYEIKSKGLIKKDNNDYYDSDGNVVIVNPKKYLESLEEDISNPIVFSYFLDAVPFEIDIDGDVNEKILEAINLLNVHATGKIKTPLEMIELNNQLIEKVDSKNDFYTLENNKYLKKNKLLYYVELGDYEIKDGIPYGTCKLVFNYNVIPTDCMNAISVTFNRYIRLADRINGCKFGCMYGLNNQGDRFFVSGNKTYPNMDYHTIDACLIADFSDNESASKKSSLTYFGDLTYTMFGGTTSAVNGYAILGDGKLAVFKTLSGQEPTIYFRTTSFSTETIEDINGNTYKKITENYPIQVGTIGEGSIGFNTIQNLNGDVLMLSENGVFGIELDSNVASSQRLAKRRSRLIDPVISKYDLSKATCITFDDKYYLCLNDGKVFIADARFPIKLNDDLQNEFNYEWWEWNGINARFFFIIDNKLWFSTDTGMLCCFEEINYKDVTALDITAPDICVVEDENSEFNEKLVIAPQFISDLENMSLSDTFISNNPIYAFGFEVNQQEVTIIDNQICCCYKNINFKSEEDKNHYIDFMINLPNYSICVDKISQLYNTLSLYQEYKLNYVMHNDLEKVFIYDLCIIKDKNLDNIEIVSLYEKDRFRVCLKLFGNSEMPCSICNVGTYINDEYYEYKNYIVLDDRHYFMDSDGNYLEIDNEPRFNHFSIRDYTSTGKPLKLVNYNGLTPVIDGGKFFFNTNVKCHYITPPFDMGTRYFNKDLHKLIIVPDTLLGTSVDFGFKTSNYSKDFNAYTGRALSFNDLNFDALNFTTETFAKVYVKTAKKKRWSYIQFYFKSDTDNNCKINNLTIVYTLGTKNKGVR